MEPKTPSSSESSTAPGVEPKADQLITDTVPGSEEIPVPKKKKLGSSRSVETLFRNIYRVHVEVSALADNKANFLISVNSIIMILATAHGKDIVTDPLLVLPAAIIVISCVGSMIFAVLVARPRITNKTAQPRNPESANSPNLLFFGSFTHIPKEEYLKGMSEIVSDPQLIYPAMTSDVYDMGMVLSQKYGRLKIAYGFMLFGMPTGVVVFLAMQTILRLLGIDQ